MPSSHRRYAGWTVERIREDARKIGKATAALCEQILKSRPHPEQGYRACLGIVRLAGSYGARASRPPPSGHRDRRRTYGSVKSILDTKLDRRPRPGAPRMRPRSAIPTSAGPATTIEENATCSDIPPSISFTPSASREWPRPSPTRRRRRGQGPRPRRLARPAPRQETSWRRDKRLAARLRAAKLRQQASVEDVDYRAARGLDRTLFQKLSRANGSTPTTISLWSAPPASARAGSPAPSATEPAATIARSSIIAGRSSAATSRSPVATAAIPRLIRALGRADLLILDDFGLEPLDAGARHDLLEILEERYGRRSTIVTSQLPLSAWHDVIGDPSLS